MTRYHAYIEEDTDGTCMAHIPDLAGCAAGGPSRDVALAALPYAVRDYLDWCARHGDPLPDDGIIEVSLAEVVKGCRPWRIDGAAALFSADRAPLGDVELRTYLRRMGYAREDLLALLRSRDAEAIVLPEGEEYRTVGDLAAHIVQSESWTLSRLGLRPPESSADGPTDQLIDSRARSTEAILRLSPRQRDLVYVPTHAPSDDPEEGWTLRKVLRRILEHEMEHVYRLQRAATPAGVEHGKNLNITY